MTKKILAGLLIGAGLFAVAPSAHADPNKKDDQYGYTFGDDLLKADAMGATGAQIKVLPKPKRDKLLRPRVHFVAEMLKSVENM